MKILITGVAGFIGMHLAKELLKFHHIIGIDNINNYYEPSLKKHRIKLLTKDKKFKFYKCDLINEKKIIKIFKKHKPEVVINLAAQAGVRYSIDYPEQYINSNIIGFHNVLKSCVANSVKKLLFASTSSVYGLNKTKLNKENNYTNTPLSVYAATKITNENLAHVYSYLYKINIIGLRFFTVYGPYGRPDMALFKFVKNILNNQPIKVFNKGQMKRSFTYIEDVVDAVKKLSLSKKINYNKIPYDILNVGNEESISLIKFIKIIEKNLKKKASKKFLPMQKGDVKSTRADTKKLYKLINYKPKTKIEIGIKNFIDWYKNYYLSKKK